MNSRRINKKGLFTIERRFSSRSNVLEKLLKKKKTSQKKVIVFLRGNNQITSLCMYLQRGVMGLNM